MQELLAAADMLQIPEVVSECCDFLCRELHPSNGLGILRFAEAHHCEELAQNAQNYVFTNFPQVRIDIHDQFDGHKLIDVQSSKLLFFLQVAQEDEILDTPQTLLSRILTSELLRVDSETQVGHQRQPGLIVQYTTNATKFLGFSSSVTMDQT